MNLRKLFDYSVPMVAAATVIVVGAIIVALIAACTTYDIKLSRDSVEVTGSAKRAVVADTARIVLSLETRTGESDQQAGYERLEAGSKKIVEYMASQGITDYEVPPATSYPNYTYIENAAPIFMGYTVNRQLIFRTSDIEKASVLANNVAPFGGEGYTVAVNMLELTYSKLAEMRVELLSEAIKDAEARAEAIAKESGRAVGALRNAEGGVVQVLPQGGIDISDYGSYDTMSKNKDIMVTVRATFEL